MPPRIPGVQRLNNTLSLCIRPAVNPSAPTLLPITQTASLSDKAKRKLAKQDPYRWAQMQQRKNAHLKRREEIEAERRAKLGDPIRGIPTPFTESFDSAGQAPFTKPRMGDDGKPIEEPRPLPTAPHLLNHLVHKEELDAAVQTAFALTKPIESGYTVANPEALEKSLEKHKAEHDKAVEALQRILDLNNGSAKDRRHANIRRCIDIFGRHNTDLTLPPKPLSRGQERQEKPIRAGPDTGSSEVQIAILTAKIQAMANELAQNHGHRDKAGKRNLRLLVHRRQRLMAYMERKERGSARWHHMLAELGLGEANYKGQISF
ncbi:ribosomal protein S15 [Xylariaceae sp. FL0594]|nr:ribosomal protein S15 [Xylariaceae sp. FL0594]